MQQLLCFEVACMKGQKCTFFLFLMIRTTQFFLGTYTEITVSIKTIFFLSFRRNVVEFDKRYDQKILQMQIEALRRKE